VADVNSNRIALLIIREPKIASLRVRVCRDKCNNISVAATRTGHNPACIAGPLRRTLYICDVEWQFEDLQAPIIALSVVLQEEVLRDGKMRPMRN